MLKNCFLIDRNKFLFVFFLMTPFINIFNYRVSPYFNYFVFGLFLVFSLLSFNYKKQYSLKFNYLMLFLFFLINLYIVYVYRLINQYDDSIYYIRFFGLFMFIFIFLLTFYDLKRFLLKYYIKLLKYFVIIIFVSIIIDSIILYTSLNNSLQPMYKTELYSYHDRPFGIFGQPSVNSVLIVFFYTVLLSKSNLISQRIKIKYFVIVSFAVLIQNSGSGFLSLSLLLAVIISNFRYSKLLTLMFSILIIFIIFSNLIEKISYEYIVYLFQHSMKIVYSWTDNISSIFDVLFGVEGAGIDFGPMFLISKVGVVYFTIILLLFLYLMYKSKNKYIITAILILLVGNLHYPVIFYVTTQFFLALFVYSTLNKDKTIMYK